MAVVTERKVCIHCETPFKPNERHFDFCCAGCKFVHGLIVGNGLGQFYDLQDSKVPPAPSSVFQPRDYAWLEALVILAAGKPLVLDLQGLSCIGCVWLIERLFHRRRGSLALRIDSTVGRLSLETTAEFDHVAFAREVQSFGYLVGPPSEKARPASRALIARLGLCGALAMNAMLFTLPSYLGMKPNAQFASLFAALALVCGTLSFLIGGSYFIARAWRSIRARVLHIDLPIALGLIAAWTGSLVAWQAQQPGFVYFDFVSMFTFLMLAGRWLQQKAVESNRARLLTTEPNLIRPEAGEKYQLAPGATVPVRSMLLSSAASLSLEWISGEPEAHVARVGQTVPAGAINLTSLPIRCEALEPWAESLLSRVVEKSRREVSGDARLESFLRTYLVIILLLAGGAFTAWLIATGDLFKALQVLTSLLVVSCPCAAGVAIPIADELAAAAVQRVGLFLRDQTLWGRLLRVKQIAFDKTGTLTLQGAELSDPAALDRLLPSEQGVLLAIVRENLHPVASALREVLMARGVPPTLLESPPLESIGLGLEVEHQGHHWSLGRPSWVGIETRADCVLARDGLSLAEFNFTECVRSDARAALSAFASRGIELAILSGDRTNKVQRLAADLGTLPNAFGGLSPDQKAEWLRTHDGEHTLMIGDGANDSLAFNEALCTGTPVIDRGLLEHKADFYFLGRSLGGLRNLFDSASLRDRAVRRVITFAIAYNAVAVAICMAGRMSPLAAAVLMPLSSLVTIGIVLVTFPRWQKGAGNSAAASRAGFRVTEVIT
jgi:Cu2+-exporting ATPase